MNELMELRQLAQQIDIQEAISLYNKVNNEIERLNKKIDKAIEFVNSMEYCGQEDYFYDLKANDVCGNDNTFNDSKNKLLDILKGSDKE